MERAVLEALAIQELEDCGTVNAANRKSEWGRVGLRQLQVHNHAGVEHGALHNPTQAQNGPQHHQSIQDDPQPPRNNGRR